MSSTEQPLCEQISYQQVAQVVEAFYKKLLVNEQLGHFFDHIDDFSNHEKRIIDFWWMSMGGKLDSPPKIDMIGKHFALGLKAEDLETWLGIFSETLGENLDEEPAKRWMDKAFQIAARIKQIVIDHKPMGIQIQDKQ